MTLEDLEALGIVTASIEDSELGRKYIACYGKRKPYGGIESDNGEYSMADTPLEAAMEWYLDGVGDANEIAAEADALLADDLTFADLRTN